MIVIDAETTGIHPVRNCIVSLGAVNYDTDDTFYGECRIYDDTEVHPIALQVNGFTEEQIRDTSKPAAHELYWQFLEWAKPFGERNLLAGHNVGHFDILFLEQLHTYLPDDVKFPFQYRTVDTHSIAFAKFKQSLKLDEIAVKIGIGEEPKPHNALTGAIFGKKVLQALL